MEIRPAQRGDLARLQEIERLAGARFVEVGMPEIAADAPPTIDELAGAAFLLVAVEEAGELVGYARVELVEGHAHLEQLSVVPAAGGRGVGTALLDAVATWARDRGDEQLTLTTFRDVAFNAPFYARRGYEVIPDGERSEGVVALMAVEAEHGLDLAGRVAMRRWLG